MLEILFRLIASRQIDLALLAPGTSWRHRPEGTNNTWPCPRCHSQIATEHHSIGKCIATAATSMHVAVGVAPIAIASAATRASPPPSFPRVLLRADDDDDRRSVAAERTHDQNGIVSTFVTAPPTPAHLSRLMTPGRSARVFMGFRHSRFLLVEMREIGFPVPCPWR